MNQTPTKVIYIVIIAIGILASFGVITLCLSLFLHTYADPAILTALISITSALSGSLVTLLSSTRTQTTPNGDSTTEMSSTITTTTKPPPSQPVGEPIPVVVTNRPTDPVPVEEPKKPLDTDMPPII